MRVHSRALQLILGGYALFVPAAAEVFSNPGKLAKKYDFIIVGGGTAGCVLANRLTEDPDTQVLLIEAGTSADDILATQIPFLGVTLPGTTIDWNFTTTAQKALNGRSFPFTRGQALGGSSVINLLTWNRGSNDIWDRWAEITHDDGWSWAKLKTSHLVAPADGHDTSGEIIPSAHTHTHGPVQVSVPGFPTELDSMVINSAKKQPRGSRFPFNPDLNSGDSVGMSLIQSSIGGGMRSHAANAYLDPVLNRANLHVLTSTHVTRLIATQAKNKKPTFGTVEFAQSSTGHRSQISATKEVILSAGVIGTPQLLLLSGIGPTSALKAKNIKTIVDSPSVGQNLTDHPLVANYFQVNSNKTFDALLHDPALIGADIATWIASKSGNILVDSPGNTQGFLRLPNDAPVFTKNFQNPASGPGSGNTEFIFVDGFAQFGPTPPPATGNFMSILTAVVSPTSRGTVSLASTDPFDQPLIDPAILTTDFDMFAMVQTMKDAQTFIKGSPFNGFVHGPFGQLAGATTDALKEALVRDTAETVNHPAGTAAMSPVGASWGVVDPDLRVKGAGSLRIVDASIFPQIPESHIQAPVYTVAERAASLIKAAHGIPDCDD
ncbi:aryl-alcohol-oxidase from pleurotus Eryingii [Hysterangium stoloniferum]|nr:aryl-alcohol-oxidase from pleurotus Eryingii [Hysterangium stoloniferum]